MQDSVNTVIHDTVHTMSFDTIHTVAYDTVHTTVFDTVRVVLDSSFTPQLLRDSQAFYSSAFNFILVVIGIIVAIFVLAMTIAWNKRFDAEIEKLHNKINEEVKIISEKAFEESKEEFEKNVNGLREKTSKIVRQVDSLIPRIIMVYLVQARIAKDINDCLRYCIFAFDAINENFEINLFSECEIVVSILEKKFEVIYVDIYPELKKILVEHIENFESLYFEYFANKNLEEKEKAFDFIKRINAIKSRLE